MVARARKRVRRAAGSRCPRLLGATLSIQPGQIGIRFAFWDGALAEPCRPGNGGRALTEPDPGRGGWGISSVPVTYLHAGSAGWKESGQGAFRCAFWG